MPRSRFDKAIQQKSLEGTVMTHFRFSRIARVFCLGLLFLHPYFSSGQNISAADTRPMDINASESAQAESEPIEPLRIKLSVNEVRLDVVVLDKKTGNPVTDLTAADFEVSQDGKRQNVLSSVYIGNQSDVAAKPPASRKDARNLTPPPPLPTVDLEKEDVHRTIIFVVDDISMSFENGYYAKMALRNFVEKQMQPGDMIAILKTGYGSSAIQMFLSDKREALARVAAMRMEMAFPPSPDNNDLYRVYDNQLSSLSYGLRALKDMPGRKILIMMTTLPKLIKPRPDNKAGAIDFHNIYNERFIRLADDALRAGVVVNFLDIEGLNWKIMENDTIESVAVNGGFTILGADASMNIEGAKEEISRFRGTAIAGVLRQTLYPMNELRKSSPNNILNPLPIKTGGVSIEDSNFFLDGIGKETENLMKGYYLITYAPPPDTFSPGGKEIYHQIKVNVKRRSVQIYTRDGFFNRLQNEKDAAAQPAHPLQNAIFSPFRHADLTVNIAAGYMREAKAGYLIRSWIHIDPKDVKIVETQDGGARIDIETVCLTSDTNGYVQDFKHVKHTFNIDPENKSENLAWIQKHGIRYAMLLPVKKPGSYYVRAAVEDTESGKTGSAYQFMEIPNLDKKKLGLSNIFVAAGDEDLKWLLSDAEKGMEEGLFSPVFHAEEVRSPALRTYTAGDRLQTLAILYNADVGSEIEIQSVLYKDGVEYLRGNPMLIAADKEKSPNGIPLTHELAIGSNMPPGDYVLQLIATDKKNGKNTAFQSLSFKVIEN